MPRRSRTRNNSNRSFSRNSRTRHSKKSNKKKTTSKRYNRYRSTLPVITLKITSPNGRDKTVTTTQSVTQNNFASFNMAQRTRAGIMADVQNGLTWYKSGNMLSFVESGSEFGPSARPVYVTFENWKVEDVSPPSPPYGAQYDY